MMKGNPTPNIDNMSEEEAYNYYKSLSAGEAVDKQQQRALAAEAYPVTPEGRKEALRAGGLDNIGFTEGVALGFGKSFVDTATTAQEAAAYVTGNDKRLNELKKRQDEDNANMKYAGVGGTVGNLTGILAQSVLPGMGIVKGLGATKTGAAILANPAVEYATTGITGATAMGAVGGAMQPLGTKDSLLENVFWGGALGAGVGATFKAGSAVLNAIKKSPAEKEVSRYIDESMASLNPSQQQDFISLVGMAQKNYKGGKPTPTIGEVFESAGHTTAMQDQLKKIVSPTQYSRVANMKASEIQQEMEALKDISLTLPGVSNISGSAGLRDIVDMYVAKHTDNAKQLSSGYDTLHLNKTPQLEARNLLLDQNFLSILNGMKKNPDVARSTRDKIAKIQKDNPSASVTSLPVYKPVGTYPTYRYQGIVGTETMGTSKPLYKYTGDKTAYKKISEGNENPVEFTSADWNEIWKGSNNLDSVTDISYVKDAIRGHIKDEQLFGAIDGYAKGMEPINKLKKTKLYDAFKKSPNRTLFNVNDDNAFVLGSHLAKNNPELLQDLTNTKLIKIINSTEDAGFKPAIALKNLEHIQALNQHDPIVHEIIEQIKEPLMKKRISFAGGPPGQEQTGIRLGMSVMGRPYVNVTNPLSMFNRLRTEKNQKALVDIIINPEKYGALLTKALKEKKLVDFIDHVGNETALTTGHSY